MRGVLLAGVGVLALSVAGPARAQFVCANCTDEITEVAREAARIQQVIQQINYLKSQLTQMENIYGSVTHLPDSALSQLGQQMNVPQFRNPLPTATGAVGALINGSNMGSLTGLGQQYLGQNRIYVPNATDFNAVSMASNSNSIAGVQSMSDQLYQSAAAHNQALQQLEGQLAAAPDEKAVADISARVQLEQTYIQSQQVQAQAIAMWQQAQMRSVEQQREESRRCYIDATLSRLDSGSESPAPNDNCAQPGAANGGVILAGAGYGGAAVASGYDQYLGQTVGTGQCVALLQAADPGIGSTSSWVQGSQVMGNSALQPGTPIATFDGSGQYANATDGSSHAAIYLGQNAQGIQVEDQWLGHPASTRTIPWNSTTGAANTGSQFYVVSHS